MNLENTLLGYEEMDNIMQLELCKILGEIAFMGHDYIECCCTMRCLDPRYRQTKAGDTEDCSANSV